MKKRWLSLIGIVLLCSCGMDLTTSPSQQEVKQPLLQQNVTQNNVALEDSFVGDCTVLQLDRKNIKIETECLTLRVFVPAENADYVNLWTPEINHTLLKHCPVNEWCEYTFTKLGTYRIRFAVEKKKAVAVVEYVSVSVV